jgi:Rrf2 family protein
MKLTAHEEYGLRCLLQIGKQWPDGSLTIPAVSRKEGISIPHAGKILQMLRQNGFLKSVRGQAGGYALALPPDQIIIRDVLAALGGRLYEETFCRGHKGLVRSCTHSPDCSIRSLWRTVQAAVDEVLGKTTLKDLLRKEVEMASWLSELVPLPADPPNPAACGSAAR